MKCILILLYQIAKEFPLLLTPHLKMLKPYLKSGSQVGADKDARLNEEKMSSCAVELLTVVVPFLVDADLPTMSQIEVSRTVLTYRKLLIFFFQNDLMSSLSRRMMTVCITHAF
jgi:hypothetical protein